MAGKHAYRPNVSENDLESRVVLSHGAIAHFHAVAGHHANVHASRGHHVHSHHVVNNSGNPGAVFTPPNIPVYTPPGNTTPVYTPPVNTTPVYTPPVNITPPTDPPPIPNPPVTPVPTGAPAQSLSVTGMSAAQFSSVFAPVGTAPAMRSSFQLAGATSGAVVSQVFQGSGAASGLYAYVYQFDVAGGSSGLQGASWHFGDTPAGTDLTGTGHANFAYLIQDGAIGGLNAPQGGSGQASLSWQPGSGSGTMSASFGGGGLGAGTNSATVVLLSTRPPQFQQIVNIQGANAGYSTAYAPDYGTIGPLASKA